jgi:hypothetical protein
MTKKIAIIGTTISLHDAPYDDPDWEIWGLNGGYIVLQQKRWDKWFDLHDLDILKEIHHDEYLPFLKSAGDRLYMNKKYEEFPDANVFPYNDLVSKYGNYFTNTIAWLIALAIEQEPEEIGIWGVNMACDTEYFHQRPCCEYFMGIAEGKGIKVTIPESSELLKGTHLYGVEDLPSIMKKMPNKEREVMADAHDADRRIQELQGNLNWINGYIECMNGTRDIVDKIGNKKDKQNIIDFYDARFSDFRVETTKINEDLQYFTDRVKYMNGAKDLINWVKLNFPFPMDEGPVRRYKKIGGAYNGKQ